MFEPEEEAGEVREENSSEPVTQPENETESGNDTESVQDNESDQE